MSILNEQGVHGLRYWENRLQIFTDGKWIDRPQPVKVYGVRIDTQNPDPFTAVEYTDDAKGMEPGSEAWDQTPIFAGIRPCMLKNGTVQYYLQANDYTKKLNGEIADITSGADGDVMIEVPRLAYMLYREGNYQIIKVTNSSRAKEMDARYCYYAHTREKEGDRERLYYGAYLGWCEANNTLNSLSGKVPYHSQPFSIFRAAAQKKGSGYDLTGFYPLTLLQCLCVLRYKNLDSQKALGVGHVNNEAEAVPTGAGDRCGLYCPAAGEYKQVKFAGIEDFWGHLFQAVDGLYLDGQRNILTAFRQFNDTGDGYSNHGQAAASNLFGMCKSIQGTSETGFIMSERTLASETYWCNSGTLVASSLAMAGGAYNTGEDSGAFLMHINLKPTAQSPNFGARLMYL